MPLSLSNLQDRTKILCNDTWTFASNPLKFQYFNFSSRVFLSVCFFSFILLRNYLNSTNTDNPILRIGGNCADSISYKSSRWQNKALACLMEFEMIVDLWETPLLALFRSDFSWQLALNQKLFASHKIPFLQKMQDFHKIRYLQYFVLFF